MAEIDWIFVSDDKYPRWAPSGVETGRKGPPWTLLDWYQELEEASPLEAEVLETGGAQNAGPFPTWLPSSGDIRIALSSLSQSYCWGQET